MLRCSKRTSSTSSKTRSSSKKSQKRRMKKSSKTRSSCCWTRLPHRPDPDRLRYRPHIRRPRGTSHTRRPRAERQERSGSWAVQSKSQTIPEFSTLGAQRWLRTGIFFPSSPALTEGRFRPAQPHVPATCANSPAPIPANAKRGATRACAFALRIAKSLRITGDRHLAGTKRLRGGGHDVSATTRTRLPRRVRHFRRRST